MRPSKRDNIESAVLADEGILLNTETDAVAYCNQSVMLVYQLCNGEHTVDEITALLVDAFPEDADQICDDVPAIVDRLATAGILDV